MSGVLIKKKKYNIEFEFKLLFYFLIYFQIPEKWQKNVKTNHKIRNIFYLLYKIEITLNIKSNEIKKKEFKRVKMKSDLWNQ